MKNLLITIASLLVFSWSFSSVNLEEKKVPLNMASVPNEVKESFNNSYFVNSEDVKWYPYPYRTSNNNANVFSTANYLNVPEYFEAEFVNDQMNIKKVYSADGVALLKVEVLDRDQIPVSIVNQMKSEGYEMWGLRTFEHVTDLNTKESFYKVIITNWTKTRALYFTEDYQLDKLRKWDEYIYGNNNKGVILKSAYNGVRKSVSASELPTNIYKNISRSINIGHQALGYWEVEPVHLPESRNLLEYYDIKLQSIYEVVYKKGRKTFKNSYSADGVFLERVEIITWDKLPKYALEATEKKQYTFWIFEENIEKVKLDNGSTIYRLHAVEDGVHQVLVIDRP